MVALIFKVVVAYHRIVEEMLRHGSQETLIACRQSDAGCQVSSGAFVHHSDALGTSGGLFCV